MRYILASASPRRREILATLGVAFTVLVADADESCDLAEGMDPADGETVIIASDTLVVLDGEFLGKPLDEADAARMMYMLQGRTHTVASGIAVWHKGRTVTAHELTEVSFSPMTEEEIFAYVATGESFGKAGGYAIQGHAARYITGIRGDYFNVVGLPVRRLYETLKLVFGIHL